MQRFSPGWIFMALLLTLGQVTLYHCALMSQVDLSLTVDPFRLASQGRTLQGSLPLCDFPRLADGVEDAAGAVFFRLEFRHVAPGRDKVSGHVEATVRLLCQRCLEPFAYALESSLDAWLVETEVDLASFPDEEDVVLVPEGRLHVASLIEDELLLAIPFAPLHADLEVCRGVSHRGSVAQAAPVAPTKPNPFAVLAQLKDKDRKT